MSSLPNVDSTKGGLGFSLFGGKRRYKKTGKKDKKDKKRGGKKDRRTRRRKDRK